MYVKALPASYTVKKVIGFPVPSRDVTSRLRTGKPLAFYYSVESWRWSPSKRKKPRPYFLFLFSYLRVRLSLLPAGARRGRRRTAPSLFCPCQMTRTVRGNGASYNLLADGQGALGQSTQARLQEGGPPDRRRHRKSLSRPGRRAVTQWRRGGRGW